MSFFTSRTGKEITGSDAASFAGNFKDLPDNTQAPAIIKSFQVKEYEGEAFYQIVWRLVDGDFAGAEVKQRITPFDADDVRADRAMNMLMRIFKLCQQPTNFTEAPGGFALASMKGNVLSIKIGNGVIQGTERTWVREVWPEGELEISSGSSKIVTGTPAPANTQPAAIKKLEPQSALTRAAQARDLNQGEDLPF